MNIFLTGSRDLTEIDKNEIYTYLERYGWNHDIHVLCDKSVENEVLKFFIENDSFSKKLHIYTFQPYRMLPSFLKKPIDFLKEKGANYTSFEIEEMNIKRTPYETSVEEILSVADLIISFYNGDNSKRLIPIDVAKEMGIDAMIYDLPGHDENKIEVSMEHKVRVV